MAVAQPAALALDGGDTRLSTSGYGVTRVPTAVARKLHDPSVTIEEYLYWAQITRQQETGLPKVKHPISKLLSFREKHQQVERSPDAAADQKTGVELEVKSDLSPTNSAVSDDEWMQAQRAARTAGWSAIFYLITTDILGPYTVPWAFAQMGYGESIALYTVFGGVATYTGYQIWQMFLRLDSYQYPMKTFGDIAFRVYGPVARHFVNILQSIQLLFNVGVIIIGNGQGLWQVNNNICYIVCCVIWTVCGMIIGQIRTLQRFGWIANFAIYMNVIVMIMTMVVVTHSPPNYAAAHGQNAVPIGPPAPPVTTYAANPPGKGLSDQIVGLMQGVYSFGGAMLFCEFLSEMRRPWDFWKALICAESFIYGWYMFFGVYVYSFQGQYTINPANQGMSMQGPLKAGNIISFISTLLAAALYGNIGIKVLYQNIFKEICNLPDLTATRGKIIFAIAVPVYWTIAWLLAAAIPQFSALSALVAALCILQFTYTFPPILMLGLQTKADAIQDGEGFDPATGQTTRHDKGMKRWRRGFFAGQLYIKIFNLFLFLGAMVCMVLGVYSSILTIITTYQSGAATAFSCTPLL